MDYFLNWCEDDQNMCDIERNLRQHLQKALDDLDECRRTNPIPTLPEGVSPFKLKRSFACCESDLPFTRHQFYSVFNNGSILDKYHRNCNLEDKALEAVDEVLFWMALVMKIQKKFNEGNGKVTPAQIFTSRDTYIINYINHIYQFSKMCGLDTITAPNIRRFCVKVFTAICIAPNMNFTDVCISPYMDFTDILGIE